MPKDDTPRRLFLMEMLNWNIPPSRYSLDPELLDKIRKAGGKPPKDQITEKNIEQVEKETIEIASRAIYVLEDALAKWDGLGEKPDELKAEFDKFRRFRDALVGWEQRIVRSKTKKEKLDFYSRVDRLIEYARICRAYR